MGAERTLAAAQTVYADKIVNATDLNRRCKDVLNEAWDHCVTIVRNDQTFALMRRELVAQIIDNLAHLQKAFDVLQTVTRVLQGEPIDPANPDEWVTVLNPVDLRTMAKEIYSACGHAQRGEVPWEEFDALVHEWEESAWAARSPEVKAAFNAQPGEEPLSSPPIGTTDE